MAYKINLNQDRAAKWRRQENPDGPVTYIHEDSGSAPQFSHMKYKGTKKLDLSPENLIAVASNGIERIQSFREKHTESGECEFGRYGKVLVNAEQPALFMAWALWNTQDEIVYITYTASLQDLTESADADGIALTTSWFGEL
ncbi:hypothetical protein [Occallatibacter savannae]|uniref:hypothetical protein n=1 Tax=Occallatibacter savannae TaxID=1002691 RepID=UPI000D6962CB|nr:hypothetical protein [Occallatibacter savannae]